jgi:hypothetical protein
VGVKEEEDDIVDHRTRSKRRRVQRVVEINDSEDEDDEMIGEGGQGASGHKHDEEQGDDEGSDEDGDKTTPQRRDQPVRNRRQPAKFRDDELYSFKPGRGGRS